MQKAFLTVVWYALFIGVSAVGVTLLVDLAWTLAGMVTFDIKVRAALTVGLLVVGVVAAGVTYTEDC